MPVTLADGGRNNKQMWKVGMQEWVYYVKLEDPSKDYVQWEDMFSGCNIQQDHKNYSNKKGTIMPNKFVDGFPLQGKMIGEAITILCLSSPFILT